MALSKRCGGCHHPIRHHSKIRKNNGNSEAASGRARKIKKEPRRPFDFENVRFYFTDLVRLIH